MLVMELAWSQGIGSSRLRLNLEVRTPLALGLVGFFNVKFGSLRPARTVKLSFDWKSFIHPYPFSGYHKFI